MRTKNTRLGFFIMALTIPGLGWCSAESQELNRQGINDLRALRFEDALKKFEAASRADPGDADALFLQGAALNRLGRFRDALPRLEQARKAGSQHRDLGFETGWALLQTGRSREAVRELEAYESAHPGRGQTSEFLGRAYYRQGELDKAEAKLNEALARDPSLKPTVLFYLAAVQAQRRNMPAAQTRLEELLRDAPESPLAKVIKEQLVRPAPPAKPWRAFLSLGGGHNSNVIALGEGVPLPSDISRKSANFVRLGAGGSYDVVRSGKGVLTAGYSGLSDTYSGLSSFDLFDNFFYGDYRYSFNSDLTAALRVSDEYTLLGGSKFRNQVAVRPALGWRFAEGVVGEAAYTVAQSKYYFPAAFSFQDRDATTHTINLVGYLAVPRTRLSARVGYAHTRNDAAGSDFQSHGDALQIGLGYPLPWQLTGEAFYTRTWDRYDNPNSLSGTTGFEFNRQDDIDAATLQLTRPVASRLNAYLRYDYLRDRSNISFYRFKQDVISAGLVMQF